MLELLSPAGSYEAVCAAVQNGADAVYMGFGNYNARRGAKNLTEEEFALAVEYCHIRGVKVYVTLNTLVTDRELNAAALTARRAGELGANAAIVQDTGLVAAIKQTSPELPIHASTQMSVHSLDGVRRAHELGCSLVVLARELSSEQIRYICRHSPIAIEVFVHGALCVCHSGQCYMSAMIGGRSGNRGLCAQPCRMPYGFASRDNHYPLSLKDRCLVDYLAELEDMGVSSIKIEGRMKRPEYTAIVTNVYASALREGRAANNEERRQLLAAFNRQGFTGGYYDGAKGPGMFGVNTGEDTDDRLFAEARRSYLNSEAQRIPVRFYSLVRSGVPWRLAVEDPRGLIVTAEGENPAPAFHRELTDANLATQLSKTGGTPYRYTGSKSFIDPGLSLTAAAINSLRREVLDKLSAERARPPERVLGSFTPGYRYPNREEPPEYTFSVLSARQLSAELAALAPAVLYVPVNELLDQPERIQPFVEHGTRVCVSLPRVLTDTELPGCMENLSKVRALGVSDALISNTGHAQAARSLGFKLHGDFGLNVFNSQTLLDLMALGLETAALSFELMFAQVRDMSKCIDTEIIVYGRFPLMITENCIIKNRNGSCSCGSSVSLVDRTGASFPVVTDTGCRSVILNSQKLFLADRSEDYRDIGVRYARLMFTTENARECLRIASRYMGTDDYEPNGYTRGLYYRGVD